MNKIGTISAAFRTMRYLVYIFCLTFVSGCEDHINNTSDDIAKFEAQFYSKDFLEHKLEKDFEILKLDSFENFGELLASMELLSCEDKWIGLEFNHENIYYHITGYTECPTSGIISCHFNQNMIFVKNDSLRLSGFGEGKFHINELKTQIIKFNDYSEYHGIFGKRRLKPALVFLNVQNNLPIVKTKEVIKEIAEQFKKINEELGTEKYFYQLNFERYSYLDIPPPPPPPMVEE
nr:hypothetical protein [uncultured Allomuricauda sp.]